MSSFEGGYDLWVSDLRARSTRVMHKLNSGWASLETDKDGKELFLLGSRGMQKINLASEKRTPVTYSAEMEMDLAAERAYMFDKVRRQEAKRFYDKNMHGVDWAKMTKAYEKFLPCLLYTSLPLYATIAESIYHQDPSAEAAYGLAIMFYRKNDIPKFEQYLKEAIDKTDNDADRSDYNLQLSQVYLSTKRDYPQARKYALAAIKSNPNSGQMCIRDR